MKQEHSGSLETPAWDLAYRSPPLEAAKEIVAQTVWCKERMVIRFVLRQMEATAGQVDAVKMRALHSPLLSGVTNSC
jgi:hypothetical protein